MNWLLGATSVVLACFVYRRLYPPPPPPFDSIKKSLLATLTEGLREEYLTQATLRNIVKTGDLVFLAKALSFGEIYRQKLLEICRERGTLEQVVMCFESK